MKNTIYSFIVVSLTISFCYFQQNNTGDYPYSQSIDIRIKKNTVLLKTLDNSVSKNKTKMKLQK